LGADQSNEIYKGRREYSASWYTAKYPLNTKNTT